MLWFKMISLFVVLMFSSSLGVNIARGHKISGWTLAIWSGSVVVFIGCVFGWF